VYTKAQLHELSTYARDSFPKTSLSTKRAIYSRTLNSNKYIISNIPLVRYLRELEEV
jgi:hypothetical protein